jgi:signal transduction histidine kinase
LTKANASLERLVRERTAKLQEMVDELEHFSYTITHDMRAPLRAMQGFAGVMEELSADSMTAEKKECLYHITSSAARMDRLITDALSYSKTVSQELPLAQVDPGALLRGMIHSYPDFQPPKARIHIFGELPPVLGNEAGLTQCFSNLLGNAVKFVAAGKTPEVRIWSELRAAPPSPPENGVPKDTEARLNQSKVVRLWFEDNGIGIPEQSQPKIFQMFQRATRDHEGTGIGLALVRKVIARMGGAVGVESQPGKGSRFWLDLKPVR